MSNQLDHYYVIRELEEINHFPHEGIQFLDWEEDFDLINQYYIEAFGITDMSRKWHDVEDEEGIEACNKVVALVSHGRIVSQTLLLEMREGELEIGAVSTMASEKNRGYSRAVISAAAEYIVKQGKVAHLSTSSTNYPMQRVAEIVGMKRTNK